MGLFRCITIGAACAALCLNAAAGPDDIVWTLRNSTDSGPRTSTPTHPTTCFGIPAYNYLTLLPVYFCPGTGLTLSVGIPGTIAIDTPSSGNASSTQIVNGSDTRLTNARSTTSTLITDSTSIGRQVLTATDAAAVRSFIGVSSSGFDGAYSSLTGIPSTFAPSAHTHPVSQISDSTSVGRAVVAAADQAAARTAIGAGTSSFTPAGAGTDYLDGTGTAKAFPSIPAAQVNTDWNATSGVQQLLNKPSTFPPSAHTHTVSQISDSTVTGQALVTAASASAARTTLGLGTSAVLDVAASGDATSSQAVKGSDSRLSDARTPLAHNQAWSTITSTPTTLSGYGITDGVTSSALSSSLSGYVSSSSLSSTLSGYVTSSSLSSTLAGYPTSSSLSSTLSGYVTSSSLTSTLGSYVTSASLGSSLSGYATTSALSSGLATKFNTPSGTSSQFLDGTGAPQNFPTTLSGYGITDAYPLTGNPSGFLTSVSSSAISSALGYTPYNGSTNPNGFLTGVTSGQISTALGYTPYNGSTNPSGFLTGITGSQVTTALGFTPYNGSTNPNGYLSTITSGQVTTALGYTPASSASLSGYVPTTRTVNGHALSADITVTKADVGLGSVANVDTTNAGNITSGTLAVGRLPTAIDPANIADGSVSTTEFQSLDGVTGAIQTQINGKFTIPTGTTSQVVLGNGTLGALPDLSGYATTSALTSGLAGKFNTPTGTSSQVVLGNGSLGTLPVVPTVVSAFTNDASYATTTALSSGLAGKLNTPSGTTSQVVLGNGTLGTLPVVPTTVSTFTNDAGYTTTTALNAGLATKLTIPAGTTSQVVLGNGTLGTLPVVPTTVSSFTNDASYATTSAVATKLTIPTGTTSQVVLGNGTLGTLPVIPTTVSSFTNDANYVNSSTLTSSLATKLTIPSGTTSQVVLGNGTLGTLPVVPTVVSAFTNDAGYSTTTALTSGLATKFNTPTGTSSQCVRGDGSVGTCPGGTVTSVGVTSSDLTVTGSPVTSSGSITLALPNTGTAGTYSTVTTDAKGRVTSGTTLSINDNPARSLVTSTSATGFQVSATRNARVCYEGTVSTTSTIGGPASATVFLETAATNSTTPGDWTIKARQTYSNTITLAVVLNQVQLNNWSMCRDIAAGSYVRLRAGSITGTASVSINAEQQESMY